MKKTLLLISLLPLLSYLNASSFIVSVNNKSFSSHISVIDNKFYDKNGFDKEGINKETGTIYNEEGYDVEGFNEQNQGKKVCKFLLTGDRSYHYTINQGNNNKGIIWEGKSILSYFSASTVNNRVLTTDSGIKGLFTWSSTYGFKQESRYAKYGVCMTPLR
jgi:hypothetical protein